MFHWLCFRSVSIRARGGVLQAPDTERNITEVMLYIYPVDPNLFETRGQIRF